MTETEEGDEDESTDGTDANERERGAAIPPVIEVHLDDEHEVASPGWTDLRGNWAQY